MKVVRDMVVPRTAVPSTLSTLIASMLVFEVACMVRVAGVPALRPLAMDSRDAMERRGDHANDTAFLIVDAVIVTVTNAPQLLKMSLKAFALVKLSGVPNIDTRAVAPENINAQSVALAKLPLSVMLSSDVQLYATALDIVAVPKVMVAVWTPVADVKTSRKTVAFGA